MTRRKKLLLILLVLVLLSQVPFAYRRYKLGRLNAAIQQLNSQRVVSNDTGLVDYKGVMHVHSSLGGHSTGNFKEIIAAAKSNQLNFVVMTEHTVENFNTATMTLKGTHDGILFVNGNEVCGTDSDRLLLLPGDEAEDTGKRSTTPEVLAKAKSKGLLAFVAYPQEFKSWEQPGYDGVEVYNLYTNARQIEPLVMFFDGLWSYRSYPHLLFANFYRRPTENLKLWDQTTATGRKLVASGGNDAHSNVGVSLQDDSGKTLLGLKLDPYERSFKLVRVHVLVPKDKVFDSESLLAAIAAGHCFIGFDLFCESSGFSFTAANGVENKMQGDEISLNNEVRFTVSTPVAARILLLKDGQVIHEESGNRKNFAISAKGTYRVEVYLPQLPAPAGEQPWIISNPIYVR
jgi:hypothetical protein